MGEVYDVSYEQLREVLLPAEPAGLELGVIELADGSGLVRDDPAPGACAGAELTDISNWGRGGTTSPSKEKEATQ